MVLGHTKAVKTVLGVLLLLPSVLSVEYNLAHLTQSSVQDTMGPVQDDEALFLYALIRTMRLERILEFGGLAGYSARNFLAALSVFPKNKTALYTVDLHPVPSQGPGHYTIQKDARNLKAQELHNKPLDLIFFDAHDMVQMDVLDRFLSKGIVTNRTVIALHDTNLHWYEGEGPEGFPHQPVERAMVNILHEKYGYDALMLHTMRGHHGPDLPYRHGLTIMQRFQRLT